jgi:biotin carboxyl carrier protein
MTLYNVTVGTREYKVDVSTDRILVNGKPINARLIPLNGGGLYLLTQSDQQRELHVDSYGRSRFAVNVGGRHIVALVEKASNRIRQSKNAVHGGDLQAPMPALIVAVKVTEGDSVEKGQALVILESMKMQMEFRAPFAGFVTRMAVKPGMHVEKGALLVEVRTEKPS